MGNSNEEKTLNRYSVSLVYRNDNNIMLRSLITKANSNEEALGRAIVHFEEETKNYNLMMKCVIHINM